MLIRELRPEEAGILKDFLYEAIFLPEGVEPPERSIVEHPELRLYYEGFGSGRADCCMVAEENGRIVGAAWTRLMKDYGYVDDETPSFAISLYREYRGQGIGKQLMLAMIDRLRDLGFHHASLAVQKANYAVRMYEKVGFWIVSENEEEYIMVCDLGDDPMRPKLTRRIGDNKMEKGKIIFLNGVTSAGKTTIVEALQERRDVFFYVVANDLFQEMVGEQYLQEDYWKYLSEVIILMYHTAKLYSDMGKNVLIDGILVEREEIKPHYQQLMEIMKDNPLEIVEVYCPLDICRQRNIDRGDRYESQSDEQAALMSKDIKYSLRVDTSVSSAEECAQQIVKALF